MIWGGGGRNIIAKSVSRNKIKKEENSLWIFDYLDVLPDTKKELIKLGDIIQPSGALIIPSDSPDRLYTMLTVSKMGSMLFGGIYKDEDMLGNNINGQRYKVSPIDFVYNPHRINLGSIGIVPNHFDGGLVSNAYVVFRMKESCNIPAFYILSFLRSKVGIEIISAYDSKYGAVRANLTYEQLCRIHVPKPTEGEIKKFEEIERAASNHLTMMYERENGIKETMDEIFSSTSPRSRR